MKHAGLLLVCLSMLSCTLSLENLPWQKDSSFPAGDPALDLGVLAGLTLVQAETGISPTGYAFFDLRGIRDSSLMALLENYGGTLNVSGCMRDVLENADSVQVILDSRKMATLSPQEARADGFAGIIHVEGADMAGLPNCGTLGANWQKRPDGSYTGTFGRFAAARGKWPFPRRKGGLILWGSDERMDMRVSIGLEDGLDAWAILSFRPETMAQGVEKQVNMFRRQLDSNKHFRDMAKKIRVQREGGRLELAVAWSRHEVRQLLQALRRHR